MRHFERSCALFQRFRSTAMLDIQIKLFTLFDRHSWRKQGRSRRYRPRRISQLHCFKSQWINTHIILVISSRAVNGFCVPFWVHFYFYWMRSALSTQKIFVCGQSLQKLIPTFKKCCGNFCCNFKNIAKTKKITRLERLQMKFTYLLDFLQFLIQKRSLSILF